MSVPLLKSEDLPTYTASVVFLFLYPSSSSSYHLILCPFHLSWSIVAINNCEVHPSTVGFQQLSHPKNYTNNTHIYESVKRKDRFSSLFFGNEYSKEFLHLGNLIQWQGHIQGFLCVLNVVIGSHSSTPFNTSSSRTR